MAFQILLPHPGGPERGPREPEMGLCWGKEYILALPKAGGSAGVCDERRKQRDQNDHQPAREEEGRGAG